MQIKDSYEIVSNYMPVRIKNAMSKMNMLIRTNVNEIRIRANKGISFVFANCIKFLSSDGTLTDIADDSKIIVISSSELSSIIGALCRYSVHSCSQEFAQGFFTIENGIRVGAAGTFSSSDGGLKHISSLNFRIARQIHGCADELCKRLFVREIKSILICGGVNTGKTTLLRDISRFLGRKNKVAVIDERSEIAASVNGIPSNDVGEHTDILDGCRREDGILIAVRTLSPHVIICDEIGSTADAEAIQSAHGSGVKLISTIHAASYDDLMKRKIAEPLLKAGVFDYAVLMADENFPGKIKEIRRLG